MPFFGTYHFRKSAPIPNKIDTQTRSVCGFFLTWVGSYENHCFGINAHTFIFQVGHPRCLLFRGCLSIEVNGSTVGAFRIVRYIVGVRCWRVSVIILGMHLDSNTKYKIAQISQYSYWLLVLVLNFYCTLKQPIICDTMVLSGKSRMGVRGASPPLPQLVRK